MLMDTGNLIIASVQPNNVVTSSVQNHFSFENENCQK